MNQKAIKLNTGEEMPALGLGTWQLTGEECVESVQYAIESGYRHIDTAHVYGNHEEVGEAIERSGIAREDLFVTSKVWRTDLRKDDVVGSCRIALDQLNLDYLDLYLIHWPNKDVPVAQTLRGLRELKDEGMVKSIGVSNFTVNHLKDVKETEIEVSVNQVEFHPSLNQKGLKEYCDKENIALTAYSPLAQGKDLKIDVIQELADKYSKPPAQIILNWLLNKDVAAIPRSGNKEHIRENLQIFGWELEKEDMEKIENIDRENRILNPPFSEFDY